MDYYAMEPWGEQRADLRAGIVASTMANLWRSKGEPSKPSDFMPEFGDVKPKPRQTPEEMAAIFASFAAAHNARLARK